MELIACVLDFLVPAVPVVDQPYDGDAEDIIRSDSVASQKALYSLCLVSPLLRLVAELRLYEVILFRTEKDMPLLLRTLIENPARGNWIQCISCQMILTATDFPKNLYAQFQNVLCGQGQLFGPTLPSPVLRLGAWLGMDHSTHDFSLRQLPEFLLIGILSLTNELRALSLQLPRDHQASDDDWQGWCEEFLYQELIEFSIEELDGSQGGKNPKMELCPKLETLQLRGELSIGKAYHERTASEVEFEGYGAHSGVHWPFFSAFPSLRTIASTCGHWGMGPARRDPSVVSGPSSVYAPLPILSVRNVFLYDSFVSPWSLADVFSMFPGLETLHVTTQPIEFDNMVQTDSQPNINETLLKYGQTLHDLRLGFYDERALEGVLGSQYKLTSLHRLQHLKKLHIQLSLLLSLTELENCLESGSNGLQLAHYLPRSIQVFTLDDWTWADARLDEQSFAYRQVGAAQMQTKWRSFREFIIDSLLSFAMHCRESCPDLQHVCFSTEVSARWEASGSGIIEGHFLDVKGAFASRGVTFKATRSKSWWK